MEAFFNQRFPLTAALVDYGKFWSELADKALRQGRFDVLEELEQTNPELVFESTERILTAWLNAPNYPGLDCALGRLLAHCKGSLTAEMEKKRFILNYTLYGKVKLPLFVKHWIRVAEEENQITPDFINTLYACIPNGLFSDVITTQWFEEKALEFQEIPCLQALLMHYFLSSSVELQRFLKTWDAPVATCECNVQVGLYQLPADRLCEMLECFRMHPQRLLPLAQSLQWPKFIEETRSLPVLQLLIECDVEHQLLIPVAIKRMIDVLMQLEDETLLRTFVLNPKYVHQFNLVLKWGSAFNPLFALAYLPFYELIELHAVRAKDFDAFLLEDGRWSPAQWNPEGSRCCAIILFCEVILIKEECLMLKYQYLHEHRFLRLLDRFPLEVLMIVCCLAYRVTHHQIFTDGEIRAGFIFLKRLFDDRTNRPSRYLIPALGTNDPKFNFFPKLVAEQ